MNVRSLIALLQECNSEHEIFLCATVQPVDAVEQCPGDQWLDPYIVIHSDCAHPKTTIQAADSEFRDITAAVEMALFDNREALDRLADQ